MGCGMWKRVVVAGGVGKGRFPFKASGTCRCCYQEATDRATDVTSEDGKDVAQEGLRLEDDNGRESADASESSPDRTQQYAAVKASETSPEDGMSYLPIGSGGTTRAPVVDGHLSSDQIQERGTVRKLTEPTKMNQPTKPNQTKATNLPN